LRPKRQRFVLLATIACCSVSLYAGPRASTCK